MTRVKWGSSCARNHVRADGRRAPIGAAFDGDILFLCPGRHLVRRQSDRIPPSRSLADPGHTSPVSGLARPSAGGAPDDESVLRPLGQSGAGRGDHLGGTGDSGQWATHLLLAHSRRCPKEACDRSGGSREPPAGPRVSHRPAASDSRQAPCLSMQKEDAPISRLVRGPPDLGVGLGAPLRPLPRLPCRHLADLA